MIKRKSMFTTLLFVFLFTECFAQKYITFGIGFGDIAKGERIMSPLRLLPFDHPEAAGHQFPNPLQFNTEEYKCLLQLGKQLGWNLYATLQRFPSNPTNEWNYNPFDPPPADSIEISEVERFKSSETTLPGLRAVAYVNEFPLCFIYDTRELSLAARKMERSVSMGYDISRQEFIKALYEAEKLLKSKSQFRILIFE